MAVNFAKILAGASGGVRATVETEVAQRLKEALAQKGFENELALQDDEQEFTRESEERSATLAEILAKIEAASEERKERLENRKEIRLERVKSRGDVRKQRVENRGDKNVEEIKTGSKETIEADKEAGRNRRFEQAEKGRNRRKRLDLENKGDGDNELTPSQKLSHQRQIARSFAADVDENKKAFLAMPRVTRLRSTGALSPTKEHQLELLAIDKTIKEWNLQNRELPDGVAAMQIIRHSGGGTSIPVGSGTSAQTPGMTPEEIEAAISRFKAQRDLP